jgi:hypothetical protein
MSEIEDPAVEDAVAFLHGRLSGLLRFDGDIRPVKIVVDHGGGIVLPAMVAMLRSLDTTLCLPDDGDESMHLQVSLTEIHDSGDDAARCDRWRTYHGEPPDVRWALATIDAVRFDGFFIDGEAMTRANPLAARQTALCKLLNAAHLDAIREACRRHASIGIEKPLVVGVDPFGFDVRGEFDVYRLESPIVLRDEKDVLAALAELATT